MTAWMKDLKYARAIGATIIMLLTIVSMSWAISVRVASNVEETIDSKIIVHKLEAALEHEGVHREIDKKLEKIQTTQQIILEEVRAIRDQ